MQFIDTHSHIYLPQFSDDLDEVISRALKSGVTKIILPNIDSKTIEVNKKLSEKFPDTCFSLIGLHPTHVHDNYREELSQVFSELDAKNHYGVGEIGIDLYWDKTYFEQQKEAFKAQVDYSVNNNLPFVIHSRESYNEVLEVLDSVNAGRYKGIFHSFSGDTDDAHRVIEMGFLIGINGVVTFKNSSLPEVIKQIDLKHLVLETDSPFLAPVPHRGKRNESSYIPLIANKIAEIKHLSSEIVADVTTQNANDLFGL